MSQFKVSPPPLITESSDQVFSLQASKWLDLALLVDPQEMADLLEALGTFSIYCVSGVTEVGKEGVSKEAFLDLYTEYVASLQSGELPDESRYRSLFSSAWTLFPDHLRAIDVGKGRQLARVIKPVVQLQNHRIAYSIEDGKFRSMTFGADQISWGIQFSFPQMYKERGTEEVFQPASTFPNYPLFHKLQRWVRECTVPTPFLVDGKRVNVPMRLGKSCFSWIQKHPQLCEKGIQIGL